MLKPGQTVTRNIPVLENVNSITPVYKPTRCRVVFVHPAGRFHTVEATNARGEKLRYTFEGVR